MSEQFDQALGALRAIAEPTRLRILAICARGEFTVSEVCTIIGQSQPRVSRHLKLMCNAGVLERFREQHWVYYRLRRRGDVAAIPKHLLDALPFDDPLFRQDLQSLRSVISQRVKQAEALLDEQPMKRLEDLHVGTVAVHRAILEEIGTRDVGDLLDIGTGAGRILELLGSQAGQAVGIDISPAMLRVARNTVQSAGIEQATVRRGDMHALDWPDESFDTIIIDQVLYLAENPVQVITEAARLLRVGGELLVIDFASGPRSGRDPEIPNGVREPDLREWMRDARLNCLDVRRLPGKPLTVLIARASHFTRPRLAARRRRADD